MVLGRGGLSSRIGALEHRASAEQGVVCIRQWSGQTQDQAIAAYEVEHGPLGPDIGGLRVIIRKFGSAPGVVGGQRA